MPLNVSESPLGKEPDMLAESKLLDNLSGKTTKVAEGVMNMIEKLPPEKLALCAAGVIGILACLDLDNPKKEGEKKKSEVTHESKTDISKKPEPVKEALSSLKKAIETPKRDEYVKRQEVKAKYVSRILRYAPNSEVVTTLIKNFRKNDALVSVGNNPHSEFELKKVVGGSFEYARSVAKSMGYDIRPNSAYRSAKKQKELWDATPEADRGRLVASAGGSWHQSGGAVDCSLVKLGTDESLTATTSKKDIQTQYTDILEYCMNRAGFVRYNQEHWHFEIGSAEWANIMQKEGFINQNVALSDYTFKKDRMGKPSSTSESMA
jgi:D-alanyl-D-alanine dipeptidase